MAANQAESFPPKSPMTTAELNPVLVSPAPSRGDTPSSLQGADSPMAHPEGGTGAEGEKVVWEAHYSLWNFAGRLIGCGLLTLLWVGCSVYTWGLGHGDWGGVMFALGLVLVLLWVVLLWRILGARFGHFYQLTTRRLFVSTGFRSRRRDQMELLRVEDVYTNQRLLDRWFSLGTVVIVSSERSLPSVALPGVEDPKHVMDLIWHHARAERDQRSVKVQEI